MNLSEAFGSAYTPPESKFRAKGFPAFKTIGSPEVQNEVQNEVHDEVQNEVQNEVQHQHRRKKQSTRRNTPKAYVLHVEIGREDCHLLCLFFLIFSISFMLSSKK